MCLPRWCTLIKCNTEAARVTERGTVSPVTGRGFSCYNGRGIMVSVLMRIMGLSSSGYNQGTKKSIIHNKHNWRGKLRLLLFMVESEKGCDQVHSVLVFKEWLRRAV